VPYTIADYLADRLADLGVTDLFMIPGNYSAQFLLVAKKRIECVLTTSEQEAGYAADAYARLKGLGIVCVTYGVGSLSTLNAIAGSKAESCPVVLINGTARAAKARQLVQQGVLFAHALDAEQTDEQTFRLYCAATAVVRDPARAPAQIDQALRACLTTRQPVYIEVRDLDWVAECPRPSTPAADLRRATLPDSLERDVESATDAAVAKVLEVLAGSRAPLLWGGEGLQRLGLQGAFKELLDRTGLRYVTTLMGKSLLPESDLRFAGVYDSKFARWRVRELVEQSDCLIALGTILGDFYGDIVQKSYDRMILAAGQSVRVGRYDYPNVPLDRFVTKLVEAVGRPARPGSGKAPGAKKGPHAARTNVPTNTIFDALRRSVERRLDGEPEFAREVQALLSSGAGLELGSALADKSTDGRGVKWAELMDCVQMALDDETTVLVDTSSVLFPSAELAVRGASRFIAQPVWLSIGYTNGAVLGAALAAGKKRRFISLVGDGGFRMGPQAFSTLVELRIPAVVIVLANGIYAIEQFLVDTILPAKERYYEVPPNENPPTYFNRLPFWNCERLAEGWGGVGRSVETAEELARALDDAKDSSNLPMLIGVRMDPKDLPVGLLEDIVERQRPGERAEEEGLEAVAETEPQRRDEPRTNVAALGFD